MYQEIIDFLKEYVQTMITTVVVATGAFIKRKIDLNKIAKEKEAANQLTK